MTCRGLALFRVNEVDEGLKNVENVPSDPVGVKNFLAEGKFFQGGNAQMLHKLLQITAGDRLLYVGDHMYADILRSKRTLGWRTCLIVPELTGEIMAYKRHRAERTELLALRREQFLLESTLSVENEEDNAKVAERLEFLRAEIRTKLVTYNQVFHPKWGPLFRAGFQESRFALQVSCPFPCLSVMCSQAGPSLYPKVMDYACMYILTLTSLPSITGHGLRLHVHLQGLEPWAGESPETLPTGARQDAPRPFPRRALDYSPRSNYARRSWTTSDDEGSLP